jgi:hypothetical protein
VPHKRFHWFANEIVAIVAVTASLATSSLYRVNHTDRHSGNDVNTLLTKDHSSGDFSLPRSACLQRKSLTIYGLVKYVCNVPNLKDV